MKAVLVSAFPPTRDNRSAPTALPYQILKHAPAGLDIQLFYYNDIDLPRNLIERELAALPLLEAAEIPRPNRLLQRVSSHRIDTQCLPAGVRRYPRNLNVQRAINRFRPDLVWLYPYWLIDWVTRTKCRNIVTTGPDSATLHSQRLLRFGHHNSSGLRIARDEFKRNIALEKKWALTSTRIHMVGVGDVQNYVEITNRRDQAVFITHPYSGCGELRDKLTTTSKLRIVVSGAGNSVYVGNHVRRLTTALVCRCHVLAQRCKLSFIGPGYGDAIAQLRSAGYEVSEQHWVDDYSHELSKHQIQIFPIAVGTGTKGKVLNSVATGLLAIGSKFAFENIAIDTARDCLVYEEPEEIPSHIEAIANDPAGYADRASIAANKVRAAHSPVTTARDFWEYALGINSQ